jgi:hypothetical protein
VNAGGVRGVGALEVHRDVADVDGVGYCDAN